MADIIFWDRSRRELDQLCSRARYWATEYQGRGLQARRKPLPLIYGGLMHQINESAMRNEDWQAALDKAKAELADYLTATTTDQPDLEPRIREWQLMLQGHTYGWHYVVKPVLEREYELLSVEESFGWRHAEGMLYATKPDVIMRRRDDGTYWYVEWKTTSKADAAWLDSWNYDVQLQLGAAAYGAVTGNPVTGCIVQGLLKGYTDDDGHLVSPLIQGWHLPPDPPLLPERWALKRPRQWKGWRRIDIEADYPGGQKAWVESWGEEILLLFPQTPPILVNEELLTQTLEQADWREREIAASRLVLLGNSSEAVKAAALNRFFPQTFKQCRPSWKRDGACDFLRCCWQPEVGADPLASGYYEARVPHHSIDPAGDDQ